MPWRSPSVSASRPGSRARGRPCTCCPAPRPPYDLLDEDHDGRRSLLACTLLPILIYATWAATPGTHPGPFEWSMTGLAFRVWLLMPLAYLGAFASGIRPARWFGSQLLPLASVAVPSLFVYTFPNWWLVGFPLPLTRGGGAGQRYLRETEVRDF